MKKLLCVNYTGNELEQTYWDQLGQIFDEVVQISQDQINDHSDADAVLLKLGASFQADDMDQFPDLKYISILGTGFGGIDVDHASKKSIAVTNIADYATQAVAEFTVGLMLERLRELARARSEGAEGNYSEDGFNASELGSKKVGILGLGAIGRRTAELAAAFGAEVSYWSQNSRDDRFSHKELEEIFTNSDIVSIHVALNDDTEGMIGSELLEKMPDGSSLFNTCPMEIMDIEATVELLGRGDVNVILDHADEMTAEDVAKIKNFKNCVIYPPIGYITDEATQNKQQVFVDNVKSFLDGGNLNRVN